MNTHSITVDLTQHPREQVIALYLSEFKNSPIARILGHARTVSLLNCTLCPEFAVGLTNKGQLLGLAGFQTSMGSFTGGSSNHQLKALLGNRLYHRLCRVARKSHRFVVENELLHNGLVVASNVRNQGIGRQLINSLKEIAQQQGCYRLRLDVACNNLSARALYQSTGYIEENSYTQGEQRIFTMRWHVPRCSPTR
jgi:ribosomal protein S18 acetylase RimI-like enzyme